MYSNAKWISKVILGAFVILPAVPIEAAQHYWAPFQDRAREIYSIGKQAYMEGKWSEAERRFREVINRFPKDQIAAETDYYLIRTLARTGKSKEALTRIEAFPRLYPRSNWRDDVREFRIQLTNEVPPEAFARIVPAPPPPPPPPQPAPSPARAVVAVPPSPPAPAPFPQADASTDPEVSLQQEIMRAVFRANPDRAFEIANERLKANPSDPLVMSSLHMVAQSRSPQALPMLVAIARNSTISKNRKDAIFWISQTKVERDVVVDTLVDLLPSIGEDVAESVTFALSQVRTDKSVNALATIARDKSKGEKARNNALFWIGQTRVANRVSLLQDIYKGSMDNSKLRLQVIFSLSQTREPEVVPVLGNIAATDPDIEVRKQAVFWLGQNRGPEAGRELENLLRKK